MNLRKGRVGETDKPICFGMPTRTAGNVLLLYAVPEKIIELPRAQSRGQTAKYLAKLVSITHCNTKYGACTLSISSCSPELPVGSFFLFPIPPLIAPTQNAERLRNLATSFFYLPNPKQRLPAGVCCLPGGPATGQFYETCR